MWSWKSYDSNNFIHSIIQEWIDSDINSSREIVDLLIKELTEQSNINQNNSDGVTEFATNYTREDHQFDLKVNQNSKVLTISDRTVPQNQVEIKIKELIEILLEYRLTTASSTTELDICTILNI